MVGRTPVSTHEVDEALELVARPHGRADDAELQEEDAREVRRRVGAAGRPGDHDRAAGAQGPQRVRPRRLAHGLDDGVDLVGQPCAGLERLVRAELDGPGALALVTAGDPHAEAHDARELDGRSGHATAGTLHEHPVADAQTRPRREHAVRREPRGRQARGVLEAERLRLADDVVGRHRDRVGERPRVLLRQQRATRVEGLVPAAGLRVADDLVHDDRRAVVEHACGVPAEDHRQLLLAQPDAHEAPQVVVVEAGGTQVHPHPALGHDGVRHLAQRQPRQRVVGVERGRGHGEHGSTLGVSGCRVACGPAMLGA